MLVLPRLSRPEPRVERGTSPIEEIPCFAWKGHFRNLNVNPEGRIILNSLLVIIHMTWDGNCAYPLDHPGWFDVICR
jgi:hypothetical protein